MTVGAGKLRSKKDEVIPTEATNKSINRELANLGWRRASPIFCVARAFLPAQPSALHYICPVQILIPPVIAAQVTAIADD
jgi:hypothetical protein